MSETFDELCERLGGMADAYEETQFSTIRLAGLSDAEIRNLISPSLVRASASQKKGGQPEDARRQGDKMLHNIRERRTTDNLSVWLERGKADVFTVTVDVTPEFAERLLQRNIENRPLRFKGNARCVNAYAAAMQRGEWELNGQPIIISDDGFLNDGQHRLHAVIASGTTVEMQITFGVRRATRHTVDQGAARTPGNILAMFGEKNGNNLAHALQFVWAYDTGASFTARPSPDQILDTLDAHPNLRDALGVGRAAMAEFRTSVGYIAAAFYVCRRIDAAAAEDFAHHVTTGLGVNDKNSSVFKLRKRLTDHLAKRENIPAIEQAALFIKAFNAHRRGQKVQNLMWRRYGGAAEAFPKAA